MIHATTESEIQLNEASIIPLSEVFVRALKK